MHLRPLTPAEFERVAAWAIAEGWPGKNKNVLLTQQEFPDILVLPGHLSFALSEPDQEVMGFGQIWTNSAGVVNLVRILVAPDLRGQGLGKKLCALLLDHATQVLGAPSVKLRVYRNNLPAVAVYRSLGFEAIESESNAEVLAMLAMTKPQATRPPL
jgi:ribosomal-protein-alanine N-acetyltransferase